MVSILCYILFGCVSTSCEGCVFNLSFQISRMAKFKRIVLLFSLVQIYSEQLQYSPQCIKCFEVTREVTSQFLIFVSFSPTHNLFFLQG